MSQGVLPYSFESAGATRKATARAGLCPYLELACVVGLLKSVRDNVRVCTGEQGYTAEQIVMALISLNLAGGECVDDLQILESDDGFGRVFRMAERYHLSREERRRFDKRFRKGRKRNIPSPSVVFRFLAEFHDAEQEKLRKAGEAFIPKANEALLGLMKVNADLIAFMQGRQPAKTVTLDMDATIVQTYKRDALYSYKGDKSYQPHNVYWAEHEMLLYSEFRDGNVPAGFEQLRVLQEALEHVPAGVDKAMLRSDTAAYQHDLLRYCASGTNKRFGVIEFAVGCDVTAEFRRTVAQVPEENWKPLRNDVDGAWIDTGREWAEVPLYVPDAICKSKRDPDYRYLATREVLKQQPLPELGGEHAQLSLPFKPVTMGAPDSRQAYKVFGAVTNLGWSGDKVLRWLYQRCGKSEEVHSIQKEDLAGGQLPSGDFGENAAWWWIMILAFNLNTLMKRLVLGDGWTHRRMKALRFHLIDVAGTLLNHAGQFVMKLNATADIFRKLQDVRRTIRALKASAPT
jgi:hypothetical protein